MNKHSPSDVADTATVPAANGAASLAVLVVGMHRSGTSALSGVLTKLGVDVPEDQIPADQHNARGYFEPERIIDFHERLLAKIGSPSNDPLPLDDAWAGSPVAAAAAEELAGLLDEEFGASAMCLFKDPRICRLMPVWTAALQRRGRAAVAVIPYRDPLEVAGSLAAKGALSRPYALFMWLQHVLLGERHTRGYARSFAGYAELMADWRGVVGKLQRELGVVWPRDLVRAAPEIDGFLSDELRHHESREPALDPGDPLDRLCLSVWGALKRFDADPYDPAAMTACDVAWAELHAAAGVFAPLVVSYQRTEAGLRGEVLQHLETVRLQSVAIGDQVTTIRDQAEASAEAAKRLRGLQTALRGRDREIKGLAARSAELAEALEVSRAAEAREWRAGEAARAELAATRAGLEAWRTQAEAEMAVLAHRLQAIETSTFWTLTYPFRRALALAPPLRRALKLAWWTATLQLGRKLKERALATSALSPAVTEPAPAPVAETLDAPAQAETLAVPPRVESAPEADDAAAPAPRAPPRPGEAIAAHVLFLSGEAHTPGHHYRIERWAEAARQAGMTTEVAPVERVVDYLETVQFADILFLWRVAWGPHIEPLLDRARAAGVRIVYDIDDLMVDPALATAKVIDGIRSQDLAEEDIADHFVRIRGVLGYADACTAPTPYLAERMRRYDKPGYVLPNGFDEDVLRRSRLAVRRRRAEPADGLVRIGYATGSRTHQRDFAACAEAVAAVLREHANARLVLFQHQGGPVLDIGEFPAFDGLADQIEWRELVPIAELPDELARFDICIAPLEVGNPFCEAKSELKYFEAALVDAPTVASPTEPYRLAITDGVTGFLAADEAGWRDALSRLVADPGLRRRIAAAALAESLHRFGPERRADLFLSMAEQLLLGPRRAARAFELDLLREARPRPPQPHVPPHEIVLAHDALGEAKATVVVPVYNYGHYLAEALESAAAQTVGPLDLIVVDDASTDDSLAVARDWLERNAPRFNRALLIRNLRNAGLGFTRNVGFANAETPYVLPLDADNRLRPHFLQQALRALTESGATFAYPRIRHFGDSELEIGFQGWSAARLVRGNYIDAMALVRRSAWAAVGGFDHVRFGWEDYDLWCRFVEHGMFGVHIDETLANYRVHGASMLRTETEVKANKRQLIEDMERRHPWLRCERSEFEDLEGDAPPAAGPDAGE